MFDDYHKTVENSNIVFLYELTFGSSIWRYTSSGSEITIAAKTYTPEVGIGSSKISNSGNDDRNNVVLTLSLLHEIAQYLIEYIPTSEISLAIFAVERDDPDLEVINEWAGVYINYKTGFGTNYNKSGLTELTFAPLDKDFGREAMAPSFGIDCQWTQYDLSCGLNPGLFNVSGTIIAITGLVIQTNVNLVSLDAAHFTGGYIEISGKYGLERSMILEVTPNTTIEVDRPLQSLAIGASITIVPSCKGEFARCKDPTLFGDNSLKFLGAPNADKVNPFSDDIRGEY